MNIFTNFVVVFVAASIMSACAVTVPREMRLADPSHRKLVDHPGKNIDSIRLACAETMLNASPVTEATDIDVRVLSTGDLVVVSSHP